jgi:hypothetical protein
MSPGVDPARDHEVGVDGSAEDLFRGRARQGRSYIGNSRRVIRALAHVRTVSIMYTAAAPKRMFGAQAASTGEITPPAPTAANTLCIVQ